MIVKHKSLPIAGRSHERLDSGLFMILLLCTGTYRSYSGLSGLYGRYAIY